MASYSDCNLRIVLLGSGKSSTGNTLLNKDVFKVSRTSDCVTKHCEIQEAKVKNKVISVTDTPGLFSTRMTEEELKSELQKCVEISVPGPHVFLLVIRLDMRIRNKEKNTVKWIQENFGENATKYTMILFTHKDHIDQSVEEYIEERKGLRQLVNGFKAGYHCFNNEDKTDQTQVTELLEKINKLMIENRGEHYTNDMYDEAQRKVSEEEIRVKQLYEKYMKQTEVKVKQMEERMNQIEEEVKQQNMADLRIVLLGKSGSGKSSTGNTILNIDGFETKDSLDSFTKSCKEQKSNMGGQLISVIDTPGMFDTSLTEENLKSEIERCVEMSAPGPHVFLLVIRLDVRFTHEEKNAVRWIQENFGEDAVKYTIILFTHADVLNVPDVNDYVRKSKAGESLLQQYGGRYHAFNNSERENRNQVKELLHMIDELVKKNDEQPYTNEIYKKAQKKIQLENFKQQGKRYCKTALAAVGGAAAAVSPGAAVGAAALGLAMIYAVINK